MRTLLLGLVFLSLSPAAEADKVVSPQVHSDRRVTFRLRAPKATQVKLWGEWIAKYNTVETMKKDDRGIWSVTVGPLTPSIYSYVFIADEVAVLDPGNSAVQTGRDGAAGNLVEVRADHPQSYDIRPVPHGVVHTHIYSSSTGLGERRVLVYTPPDYSRNTRARFPVLYLLHGSGDTEAEWTAVGRANVIADNLIADRRARSMIIVMPAGHITPSQDPEPPNFRKRFGDDLLRDVVPLVDSTYRTIPDRKGRAIAGLSMGAFQAMWFALDHPHMVSGLGILSGGIFGKEGEAEIVRYATEPSARKWKFNPLQIAIGERDMNLSLSNKLHTLLDQHKVDHQYVVAPGAGHTWPFWRQSLTELLPLLFKATE